MDPGECALDLANGKIYWANRGLNSIQRANLDGTNIESVISSGLQDPEHLALDVPGGKIYWTDWATGLSRADLNGTNVEHLVEGAEGLTLDLINNKVYFTAGPYVFGDGPCVLKANLDGTNVECLVDFGSSYSDYEFIDIALDVSANRMYWSGHNYSADYGALYSAGLNVACVGRAEVDSLEVAVTGPEAIALDLDAGKIYWTDVIDDVIARANLDGSDAEMLMGDDKAEASRGLALDLGAGKMYWTDAASGKIYRSDLTGGNAQTVIAALFIRKLVTDVGSGVVYATDSGSNVILKSSLDGGSIETIVAGSNPWGIALDGRDGKLYWTDVGGNSICRANLDGSNGETVLHTPTAPIDVELDLTDGKLYWLEYQNIKRADMTTGANVQTVVSGLNYNINDLALDVWEKKIYWIGAGRIERANVDGSNRDTCVTGIPTTGLRTSGITLDFCARKMYWTECSLSNDKVRKANFDGTGVEDVLSQFAHGLVAPQSVALALGYAAPQITLFGPSPVNKDNCPSSCTVYFGVNTQDDYANVVSVALERGLEGTWVTEGFRSTPSFPCTLSCEFDEHYTDGEHEFRAVFYCCDGTRIASSSVFVIADRDVSALISGFEPRYTNEGVVLRWATAGGVWLQGFNVYRSEDSDDGFARINERLIRADEGNEYVDRHASAGKILWYRLGAVTDDGEWMSQSVSILVPEAALALHQNKPNPFNPKTTISFTLPEREKVTLSVFDVEGRLVRTLVDDVVGEGYQELIWDGRDANGNPVGSGVYMYRLTTRDRTVTKKMVLLR